MNAPFQIKPKINYCVTVDDANRAIDEVIRDAYSGAVAIDIETAAVPEEVDRLDRLRRRLAIAKCERAAWNKTGAPASQIAAKKAEITELAAQAANADGAALDPYRARIRLLQLYGGGRRAAVVDLFRTGTVILQRLNDMVLVAHNAAFELSFLEHHGIFPAEMHCTMQACRLTLGEKQMSLADAAQTYLDVELDKTSQSSDWSAEHLTLAQIEYASRDAVVCWRIFNRVMPALGAQESAYELQMKALLAVVRMQLRGFRLDTEAHARMIADLRQVRIAAMAEYAQKCRDASHDKLAGAVPSTPNEKRALLESLLTQAELEGWTRTERAGHLSTRRADMRVAAHYPPIVALTEIATIDKLLTSFGDTLSAKLSPITGRIHASYRVAGTASGRASCSGPNLQQIPRDKRFRSLFVPDPRNVLVVADYASMELRAAAHISGDPAMTQAFERGDDMHRITAGKMSGKAPEDVTDDERSAAKRVNFGAIYGMGGKGLVRSVWDAYGVAMMETEANLWLAAFAEAYPVFARWRRQHADRCDQRQFIVIGRDAAVGVGRLYPLSRLPFGKSPYTVSCNLPVQGACADASMLALAAIDELLFEHGIYGGPVAWLHDEIILEVPTEHAVKAAELLVKAMRDAFAETFPGAPFNGLVEANSGLNWAAAKDAKEKKAA
jgi:DNA polymerase-1